MFSTNYIATGGYCSGSKSILYSLYVHVQKLGHSSKISFVALYVDKHRYYKNKLFLLTEITLLEFTRYPVPNCSAITVIVKINISKMQNGTHQSPDAFNLVILKTNIFHRHFNILE